MNPGGGARRRDVSEDRIICSFTRRPFLTASRHPLSDAPPRPQWYSRANPLAYAFTARERAAGRGCLGADPSRPAASRQATSSVQPTRAIAPAPNVPLHSSFASTTPPPVMTNQFSGKDPAFIDGRSLLEYFGVAGQDPWCAAVGVGVGVGV